jgi:hypothetical protein
MAEGDIESAILDRALRLGWPDAVRLRELAVEPPLIQGKHIADGKPKPRMECFFDTVPLDLQKGGQFRSWM